jgi:tellurite resistance protein TehA-like permease
LAARAAERNAWGWAGEGVKTLYPGYFALVMATGIIANALWLEQYRLLSDLLFWVAAAVFPLPWLLSIVRMLRFGRAFLADLRDPRLVFSFFTAFAATDVLGLAVHLRGHGEMAAAMWLFALLLWLVLIYLSFAVLTFLNTAHGANVVHRGWLIAIVGTESLVILGAAIAPQLGEWRQSVLVLVHMLWGVGLGLYGIFITLFAYRIFFFDVEPDDITLLLWVVMGAAAISTNAGSVLILTDTGMAFLVRCARSSTG